MSDHSHSHDVAPGERVPAGGGIIFLIVMWLLMAGGFTLFAIDAFRGILEAASR